MEPPGVSRATPLDRATTFALVIVAELQALLLYVAHEAGNREVALFADRTFLTVWYSVILVAPAIVSLQLRSVGDRHAWLSGLGIGVMVALLAWHTGSACGSDPAIQCEEVIAPYVFSIAVAHFILLPFLQGLRDHGWRIPYASLFHDAWDNALTLGAAAFFTGAAWLILVLWAALFGIVGIGFFKELFSFAGFIYPVTGLLAGFGVVLARHQAGALQAVLRVCLTLGRALLPLISILAIVFLGTLVFTGLQPLWDTKTATALLLLLIFGTVALVNSVLHDGTGVDSARPALRRLLGAALLTLPAYAVIAAIALSLRVQQYAWTVDRLWAAVLVFVAAAYAFAYATSVFVRHRGRWLGLLPAANTAVALAVVAVLLATQSPLLDFRSITVASQLARLEDPGVELESFDFEYFRWELGRPGYEALAAVKAHPRVAASPATVERVQAIIEAKNRWELRRAQAERDAREIRVFPAGEEIPEGLLARIGGARDCSKGGCVLLKVDLVGGPEPEWVLLDTNAGERERFPIYMNQPWGWKAIGALRGPLGPAGLAALERGEVRTVPATQLNDLVIGEQRLRLREVDSRD
jgi:hypothetical protein